MATRPRCFTGMVDVSYYRERANHLRRFAEMTWQVDLEVSLRRLAEANVFDHRSEARLPLIGRARQ